MRFLGIELSGDVPDARTVWAFRGAAANRQRIGAGHGYRARRQRFLRRGRGRRAQKSRCRGGRRATTAADREPKRQK